MSLPTNVAIQNAKVPKSNKNGSGQGRPVCMAWKRLMKDDVLFGRRVVSDHYICNFSAEVLVRVADINVA